MNQTTIHLAMIDILTFYAKMIGISPSTLNRVENGLDVDRKTMLKLIQWVFND